MKVCVLRDDGKTLLDRVTPDRFVARLSQPDVSDVLRVWIFALQRVEKSMGQIVIEKQFHRDGNETRFTFAICSEFKTRADIFPREVGKIVENFALVHAGSQVFQNVVYRDAHSTDTGLPASLGWINSNAVLIRHDRERTPAVTKDQERDDMTGLTLAMSRTCRLLNRQKGGGPAPPSSFMPNMLRQFRRVRFNPRPPSSCRWVARLACIFSTSRSGTSRRLSRSVGALPYVLFTITTQYRH